MMTVGEAITMLTLLILNVFLWRVFRIEEDKYKKPDKKGART